MNVEAPSKGFWGTLRSLNGDRAYGIALLGVCLALALPEIAGNSAREALSYDRAAISQGQWWRLLTGHFVHLDPEHTVLNGLGVLLMWALFARDYAPWRWVAIYSGAALAVSAGLWFLNPEVSWYVGASGALHGVMVAGTLAHLRRGDLDGWILAGFIMLKLGYEQIVGSMPFAGDGNTIVDAHLYGAVGGLAIALTLKSRAEPL